ncbi:MAG: S41 family peptidase [Gammaproteobacteria bacterium]|nr:S41 family peptidase [Gammaproteobacteria bacterium]
MPTRKRLSRVIGVLTLVALPLTGIAQSESADQPTTVTKERLPLEDLRNFTKVFEQIRRGYIEEIDDSTLLEYAIKGMLHGLDPHSSYLDHRSLDDLQINTIGEFSGLGIEVGIKDERLTIVTSMDDTPAAHAGLQSGDVILRLAGKSMRGVSLDEALKKMRGPVGSSITLTIGRKGHNKPFDVTLKRDTVQLHSVSGELLEPGYGYLRIRQFQLDTASDLAQTMDTLQRKGDLKGLIIDLRNNPGGVLQASVAVADAFLEEGLVVYTEGRNESANLRYSAEPGDLLKGAPMVVLINDGSASAAEIVAGALQDHRRAVVMGTDSFGKGSVQTVIPINSQRAIKLTTALYFTPNGRSIQAQGISPDIVVERAKIIPFKDQPRTSEADLARHLDNGNVAPSPKVGNGEDEKKRDRFGSDNQLSEALNLLKGLSFYVQRPQGAHLVAWKGESNTQNDLSRPPAFNESVE